MLEALGQMSLKNDAARHEIGDDRYYDQNGIPDLAVCLIFFEPVHEHESKQQAEGDAADRQTKPGDGLSQFKPERAKQDAQDQL